MKKLILFILLLSLSVLFAEETVTETASAEKRTEKTGKFFFSDIKIGFGADFNGIPGRISAEHDLNDIDSCAVDILQEKLRNQFGLSLGLNFNWRLFRKTGGEGAGELYFGFGFGFQYWVPTSTSSKDDSYKIYRGNDRWTDLWAKAAMHYMRIPLTLNILYDFKVNAGVLHRVGPVFSAGINNNLFIFKYETEPENEEFYKPIHDSIDFHQLSFTWSIGLNFLFANGCFVSVSVGGDKGSEKIKYYLFREETGNVLYHHHEFMMFEAGYRF